MLAIILFLFFFFFWKGKTAFCKLENNTTFLTLSAVHGNLHPNAVALAKCLLQPCVLFCSSLPLPDPHGYSQFQPALHCLVPGPAGSCRTAPAAESAVPREHRAGGAAAQAVSGKQQQCCRLCWDELTSSCRTACATGAIWEDLPLLLFLGSSCYLAAAQGLGACPAVALRAALAVLAAVWSAARGSDSTRPWLAAGPRGSQGLQLALEPGEQHRKAMCPRVSCEGQLQPSPPQLSPPSLVSGGVSFLQSRTVFPPDAPLCRAAVLQGPAVPLSPAQLFSLPALQRH